jgi:hypothetical protein
MLNCIGPRLHLRPGGKCRRLNQNFYEPSDDWLQLPLLIGRVNQSVSTFGKGTAYSQMHLYFPVTVLSPAIYAGNRKLLEWFRIIYP